eukprot:CCRYP_002393-RA/>CCRYP_002393-RA protein AED:0.39 eAED:0.38 QI:0/0/0/1/1/1/3/0/907
MMTPFEAWHGIKPNLSKLRVFGSRACVKRTGKRRSKLDRHDFTGIFLGYTATDENIKYVDVDTRVVKTSHHAIFDKAWYLQQRRPPFTQMLYDIGLEYVPDDIPAPPQGPPPHALYPPMRLPPKLPPKACSIPLPLRISSPPDLYLHAAAARTHTGDLSSDNLLTSQTPSAKLSLDHEIMTKHDISQKDMMMVYMSPHPFRDSFEEEFCLRYFNNTKHPTAGLVCSQHNGRLYLRDIQPSTPAAKIRAWRSRLRHAWLIKVDGEEVTTEADIVRIMARLAASKPPTCTLLMAHSELKHGLVESGIPQINADQLNHRYSFDNINTMTQEQFNAWLARLPHCMYDSVEEGGVLNMISVANKLTREPYSNRTIGRNGRNQNSPSLINMQLNICLTGSRIFYAIAAAENLLVFGADVSNAFGEAPPPKQGFYIRPDKAFHDWYLARHGKVIPDGWVIPVLAAMQGHPESPRLWEKHCDRILKAIGFMPTVHEPYLYSGHIDVDDFAIACKEERIATIIYDAIDLELQIPIKRQGLLTLFNGLDVLQSRWYIKISVETYLTKTLLPYFNDWLDVPSKPLPVPLGTNEKFHAELYKAKGNPDAKVQAILAKQMHFGYRKAIGELIWPMTTCRPDLSQSVMKCASASAAPTETHYNAVKSIFRYLAATLKDGIYYWRTAPRMDLPDDELPHIYSTPHDLRLQGRPTEEALNLCGYMDSSWGDCPITRRSTGGACMRLSGGPVHWKGRLWPTVAHSSTEAEYMETDDAGRMSLYIRSFLWDLRIPQEAATILYEDNDGATAMANAGKPTSRTRHVDIKFYAIQEWVERDLVVLKRIDTAINMADHYTKPLPRILFYRHNDYNMGRVPPTYSPKYLECLRVYAAPQTAKQGEYTAQGAKTLAPWTYIVLHMHGTTY